MCWPYSLASGAQRGQRRRRLQREADRLFFDRLDFAAAAATYERLAGEFPEEFILSPAALAVLRLQARASAAAGDFRTAAWLTRQELKGSVFPYYAGSEREQANQLVPETRLAIYQRLAVGGPGVERDLWTILAKLRSHRPALFELDNGYAAKQAREEIRLAIGSLRLRQGRVPDAVPLLHAVAGSSDPGRMEERARLARAYLAHPAAAAVSTTRHVSD